jgi:hypothetical protein
MSSADESLQVAVVKAHRHCALHYDEIQRSDLCGCFYCLHIFRPAEILDWFDDHNVIEGKSGSTALCPKCGIDSVVGSASTYPITKDFLLAMQARWFGSSVTPKHV